MVNKKFALSIKAHHYITRSADPLENFANFIDYLGGYINIDYIKKDDHFQFVEASRDNPSVQRVKKRGLIKVKNLDAEKPADKKVNEYDRFFIKREFDGEKEQTVYLFPEFVDLDFMLEGFDDEEHIIVKVGDTLEVAMEKLDHLVNGTEEKGKEPR